MIYLDIKQSKDLEMLSDDKISYRKICAEILSLHKTIRFAGAANSVGKVLWAQYRQDVAGRPLLTKEESEQSAMHSTLRMKMRMTHEEKLGKSQYAIASYEKVKRATIPLAGDYLLLVSFDKDEMQCESIIVNKIIPALKKHGCSYF